MHDLMHGGGPYMRWQRQARCSTLQSYDLRVVASLTWSCCPGVTVFLAEVINLKPCRGKCTGSQARFRRRGGRAAAAARDSHMISDWLQA